MKRFFRNIHLYLSLVAGLIIMTTCFTGAILVFEEELQEAFHHERYFVKSTARRLSLDQLVQNVKNRVPEAKISSIKIYNDLSRTAEVGFTVKDKKNSEKSPSLNGQETKTEKGGPGKGGNEGGGNRKIAYLNPYNGTIIELYSYRETFFYKMFALHRWLLGSNNGIGKYIVGTCTFIFLFILITGIILWWPKSRMILNQRLKVKWDGSWKRLNHDFHIVLGFYTAIFLFIFAFTGLAWSFQWFNKGIYTLTNSEMKPSEPPVSTYQKDKSTLTFDAAFATACKQIKDAKVYNIISPKDSAGVFTVNVLPEGRKDMAIDNYYIDQYSNEIIGSLKFNDKNLGQRVRATFKPIHVASIFGTYSKVIGFIVCVLGTTFPITGAIIWINRISKSHRTKQNTSLSSAKT